MKKSLSFTWSQKNYFILHVFLEIFKRYCKPDILGTLGMPGCSHPKWYGQLVKNFVFICWQKSTSSFAFFWKQCKDTQTSYFGYYVYIQLRIPKIISTCRKLQYLSTCQKINFISHFFLEIILKNPAIWLANNILALNSTEFCQIWDWLWNINNNISFHFRLFPGKIKGKIFQIVQKTLFWGNFGPFCTNVGKWILLQKKVMPVFKYCNYLLSCKKSEKTNDMLLKKIPNWTTHRQIDRQRVVL